MHFHKIGNCHIKGKGDRFYSLHLINHPQVDARALPTSQLPLGH